MFTDYRKLVFLSAGGAAVFLVGALYFFFFSSPGDRTEERIVVGTTTSQEEVLDTLIDRSFIRSRVGFAIARRLTATSGTITPGAYTIPRGANAFAVARALAVPNELWVTVREGLRKEEVAEIIGAILGWSDADRRAFAAAHPALAGGLSDGYFFPDTYLIPRVEEPSKVAKRMVSRFNEKFAPLAPQFLKENIRNDTAIILASLVQREAASVEDMPLIAGILWGRLLKGMPLAVDATLQYARDTIVFLRQTQDKSIGTQVDWWAPVRRGDKEIDSPYNTYAHRGLPPSPIASPGLAAIEAVLRPAKTLCLYYLHTPDRKTYCAVTYEEHQRNIERYLK